MTDKRDPTEGTGHRDQGHEHQDAALPDRAERAEYADYRTGGEAPEKGTAAREAARQPGSPDPDRAEDEDAGA